MSPRSYLNGLEHSVSEMSCWRLGFRSSACDVTEHGDGDADCTSLSAGFCSMKPSKRLELKTKQVIVIIVFKNMPIVLFCTSIAINNIAFVLC